MNPTSSKSNPTPLFYYYIKGTFFRGVKHREDSLENSESKKEFSQNILKSSFTWLEPIFVLACEY